MKKDKKEKKKKKKKSLFSSNEGEMLQSIIVTFKDGDQAIFTGKAVVFAGQEKIISDIKFTLPKPMPEDCSWGKI